MKQLKRTDFTQKFVGPQKVKPYFSYEEPGLELCLEPHLFNGFDIALYDGKQNLLVPKETINFQNADQNCLNIGDIFEFYETVLSLASSMLHRYKVKKGKYGDHTN